MNKILVSVFVGITALAGSINTAFGGGYLFVTFKGEETPMSEQIYFALSPDGRHWSALNESQPVLVSSVGEKGVRDPYLIRAVNGKKFYLLATDLSINLKSDWGRAQTAASKSIVIWESTDLVHWSAPRLVKVAAESAGCTWAPEAVYDDSRQEYLVFWASKTKEDNFAKQRIWAAWTKNFVTFSAPFIYIDKPWDVIDTDIVYDNGRYYRFSKDEQFKAVTMESSTNLLGSWSAVEKFSLAKMQGFEGPECYCIKPAANGKPAGWCLILDNYARGAGYKPFVTDNLDGGQFKFGEGFVFPFKFRHGSILPLADEEFDRLAAAYAKAKP